MQTKHADASGRFVSLDDIYYYGGGSGTIQKAQFAHKPRNSGELELEVGDKIGVAGNHWNGMSKGTNQRTNRVRKKIIFTYYFWQQVYIQILYQLFNVSGRIISVVQSS